MTDYTKITNDDIELIKVLNGSHNYKSNYKAFTDYIKRNYSETHNYTSRDYCFILMSLIEKLNKHKMVMFYAGDYYRMADFSNRNKGFGLKEYVPVSLDYYDVLFEAIRHTIFNTSRQEIIAAGGSKEFLDSNWRFTTESPEDIYQPYVAEEKEE